MSAEGVLATTWRPDGVVVLLMNRPEARNALSRALARALADELIRLADDGKVRALVLTGAGDRAFCAGADLKERAAMSAEERGAHTEEIAAVADRLAAFPAPTLAAMEGAALAGGAELAVACDLRVAGEGVTIGFPEVSIGIFPGAGGVYRLPRLVGLGAARDLLFSGRSIGETEAVRIGLIDRLVPRGTALDHAVALGTEIAGNAPLAVRALKAALRAAEGLPDGQAAAAVAVWRRTLDGTADYEEGLRAFAERRAPRFTGH